jgi:electron transfer flavoprotein alpha subunit
MPKAALLVLALGVMLGAFCPCAAAQAMAESAILHGNSTVSAGVARALGAHIDQGLSHARSQFSYPPRSTRATRYSRAYRGKARARTTGRSSIAISSVVGGAAPCAAAPKTPAGNVSSGSASSNCAVKAAPATASNAKSNPNEITVSF